MIHFCLPANHVSQSPKTSKRIQRKRILSSWSSRIYVAWMYKHMSGYLNHLKSHLVLIGNTLSRFEWRRPKSIDCDLFVLVTNDVMRDRYSYSHIKSMLIAEVFLFSYKYGETFYDYTHWVLCNFKFLKMFFKRVFIKIHGRSTRKISIGLKL